MNQDLMIGRASSSETNDIIFNLIKNVVKEKPLRIADFGCGSGALLNRVKNFYLSKGWSPEDYLLGVDIDLSSYIGGVPSLCLDLNKPLPNFSTSFDLILCVEMLEHSRRPYTFLDDLYKMLNVGGRLICSVPNVGNMNSRIKYFFGGGYQMYFGPSVRVEDAGRLSGHINPFPVHYWLYGLRMSGFGNIKSLIDRRKKGSLWLSFVFSPFLFLGNFLFHKGEKKYSPDLYQQNKWVLDQVNSIDALTGRTLIFLADKNLH